MYQNLIRETAELTDPQKGRINNILIISDDLPNFNTSRPASIKLKKT